MTRSGSLARDFPRVPISDKCRLLLETLEPSIAHVRCVCDATRHEITLEVSLPRLAFGHNIVSLKLAELGPVVELLDYLVQDWGLTDFSRSPSLRHTFCRQLARAARGSRLRL